MLAHPTKRRLNTARISPICSRYWQLRALFLCSTGETGKTCLPRRPTRNGRRLAALPEVIDTSVAFVGWNGEIPILRQEEGLSDGSTRTSFQSLNPDGSLTNLDPKSWQGIQKGSPVRNPPGLRAGTILVERHAAVVDDPQVVLKIDLNEKQMDSLRQALRDWNDGKRDASQGFPPVQASLRIDMSWRGRQPRVLWRIRQPSAWSPAKQGLNSPNHRLSWLSCRLLGKFCWSKSVSVRTTPNSISS